MNSKKNLFPNLILWHTVSIWRNIHSFLTWKLSLSIVESFLWFFLFGFNGTWLHVWDILCFRSYNFFLQISFLSAVNCDANLLLIIYLWLLPRHARWWFSRLFWFLARLSIWVWGQKEIKTIKRIISWSPPKQQLPKSAEEINVFLQIWTL